MKWCLAFLLSFFLTTDLLACDCQHTMSVKEAFEQASIVFYGRVEGVNDETVEGYTNTMHFAIDSLYTKKGGYFVNIKVKEVYKGKLSNDVPVHIKGSWGLCDVFFKKNMEYIVFGYVMPDGQIQTNVCMLSAAVRNKQSLRKVKRLSIQN